MSALANRSQPSRAHQRGAVAIMVALSLLVLLGFIGLAVDSGKLYVNEAELQTAADACALAAAQELVCQPGTGMTTCPSAYLQRAEAAGIFAGGRNNAQLESAAVSISASDVRFSTTIGPNSGYLSRAGGANANSRFAMCIARANGIVPWVMGVVGQGSTNVVASAVATLAPGQTFCSNAPIGICEKTGGVAPNFGYSVGEWIPGQFKSTGNGDGFNSGSSFEWIDFTPPSGGTNDVRDQLAGTNEVCNLQIGGNVAQPGVKQGAKLAYNTRFGVYASGGGYTVSSAPPDYTGYAYPNKSPGSPVINVGTSAYNDYVARRQLFTPYIDAQYGGTGNIVVGQDVIATQAQYTASGVDRRLISVPIIDCSTTNTVPIVGMACALMLNPMSKGNSGTAYLEYRGASNSSSSACRALGLVGGPGAGGPLVSTLVQ